jgi:hypothetical protein
LQRNLTGGGVKVWNVQELETAILRTHILFSPVEILIKINQTAVIGKWFFSSIKRIKESSNQLQMSKIEYFYL